MESPGAPPAPARPLDGSSRLVPLPRWALAAALGWTSLIGLGLRTNVAHMHRTVERVATLEAEEEVQTIRLALLWSANHDQVRGAEVPGGDAPGARYAELRRRLSELVDGDGRRRLNARLVLSDPASPEDAELEPWVRRGLATLARGEVSFRTVEGEGDERFVGVMEPVSLPRLTHAAPSGADDVRAALVAHEHLNKYADLLGGHADREVAVHVQVWVIGLLVLLLVAVVQARRARALDEAHAALVDSEGRSRESFENLPTALLVADFTGVKARLDQLAREGGGDVATALETLPGAVARALASVRFVDVNRTWIEALGALGRDHALRELERMLLAPDVAGQWTPILLAIAEGRARATCDLRHRDGAGERRVSEVSVVVGRGPGDPLASVLLAFIDITARRRADEALRARDAELRRAHAIAHLGSYSVELASGVIDLSEEAAAILGLSRGPAGLDQITAVIHPDDVATYREAQRRARAEGAAFDVEYRITRGDEDAAWVRDRREASTASRGAGTGVGIVQDITDRRRLDEELRASEERFRRLVVSAPEALLVLDAAGACIDANENACRLFELDRRELLGRTLADLSPPEQPDGASSVAALAEHQRRALNGEARHFEWTHRTDRARLVPSDVHLTPVPAGDDTLVRVSVTDITERKRVEATLEFIARRGWHLDGGEFLPALARFLSTACGMDDVVVARLAGDGATAEAVVTIQGGRDVPGGTIAFEGGFAARLRERGQCAYAARVQEIFPNDPLCAARGAEAFVGVTLWDSAGRAPLGFIALLHPAPIADPGAVITVLNVVTARVAAELERTRAAEALRESEERFRTLSESAFDGLVVHRGGTILYVNPVFAALAGEQPGRSLGGAALADVLGVRSDARERAARHFAEAREEPFELACALPDGTPLDLECRSRTVLVGGSSAQLLSVRDITRRKRADALARARLRLVEMAATGSLHEVCEVAVDEARALTGSRLGFLLILAPDGRTIIERASTACDDPGRHPCAFTNGREPTEFEVEADWAASIATRRPRQSDPSTLSLRVCGSYPCSPLERELVVPVVRGERVVALVGVGDKGTEYGRSDRETLGDLSDLMWDVWHRKRTELELVESERRFETLFRRSPDPLLVMGADGTIVDANPALAQLNGAGGLLTGRAVADLLSTETPGALEQACAAWAAGQPSLLEASIDASDGRRAYVEIGGSPVTEGGREALLLVLRDMTERRAVEERLRKLSRAVEQSQHSVVITDARGIIEFVNPRFTEATGYSAEEAIGQTPRIVRSDDTAPNTHAQLWTTITAGRVWKGELLNRKKSGELHREFVTVSPVRNAAGAVTHYVAIKEDVTERRRMEERLREAQKLDAIGRLAGGVAHDFNNILTGVLLRLKLLQEEPGLDEAARAAIVEVEADAERASSLTRQLLLFARRSALELRVVDVNEVVTGLTGLLTRLAGEAVVLGVEPAPAPALVEADASLLERVVVNLVVNARDALRGGGRIGLRVEFRRIDEQPEGSGDGPRAGAYVCLSVSDTGSGLDPQTKAQIFEPFFTTKGVGKGTGLGLATVHGIVVQHRGWVEVDSEPGAGATFRVFLPRSSALASAAAGRPAEAPEELVRGTGTILLVEDEHTVRSSTALVLRGAGYTVVEASDGPDALRCWHLERGRIDLLFTDMVMPGGMSGLDLVDALRRRSASLPAVVASGYSASPALTTRTDITFLPKPYPADVLRRVVRDGLQAKAPAATG